MEIWSELNKIGKKPLVAKIGGFRPEKIEFSTFGGGFYMKANEEWPSDDSGNLIPIIQIYIEDFPESHLNFGDIKLIQIYLNQETLPMDYIASNGKGWLLKEYKEIDDLVLQETPRDVQVYKSFPIRWSESDTLDFPCWEDTWNFFDLSQINDSKELTDEFFDKYKTLNVTKIGGYGSYMQSPIEEDYEFMIQISSDSKTKFIVADSGNIYIYKDKNTDEWYLHWDCF